jgi:hypothetical protein
MNILITSEVLDLSGTVTYTLTLYRQLIRLGHRVTVYSPKGGAMTKYFNWVGEIDYLDKPDLIIAQMNTCAETVRARFDSFMIFSSHGIPYNHRWQGEPDRCLTESPPNCPVDAYTAINEDVQAYLQTTGYSSTIIRDFIDLDRFKPTTPPNSKIKRILFISNYKKWRTYARVSEACRYLGIELKAVGAPYGRAYAVETEINQADLVISTGRGILEAMACERPVISFEQMHGDGYLTEELYYESRTRQFFGPKCLHTFEDWRDLVTEIHQYNPLDGKTNRRLIEEHHNSITNTKKLLNIWEQR